MPEPTREGDAATCPLCAGEPTAQHACGLPPFAAVYAGDYDDEAHEDIQPVLCWRHLRALGDTRELVVRRAANCVECGESMGDETSTRNGQPCHIRCPRDYPGPVGDALRRLQEKRDAEPPRLPMLRDEATDWLLSRLNEESHGTLRVHVDHGLFKATYATGVTPCEGEWLPNLTDALCSLIGLLP